MFLVVSLGLAYWVSRDATERGDDDATPWTLAAVVAGVIVPLFGAVGVGALYTLVGRG